MPVQKQGEEGVRAIDDCNGSECKRICFLDLDDTLIPTTWLRTEFSRLHSFAAAADELYLYSSIKQGLDRIVAGQRLVSGGRKLGARKSTNGSQVSGSQVSGTRSPATSSTEATIDSSSRELEGQEGAMETIDDLVIEFVRTIQAKHDVVVIVTNARSYAWVQMFRVIFPKLAETLNEMGVGIIKTEPRTAEPDGEVYPEEYFQYWCDAKYYEFNKCIEANPSHHYELTCVGDNNFEHFAFMQLCNHLKPTFAHVIKCTCGLGPQQFVKQLRTMNQRMTVANYRLGLQKLTPHVEAVTWMYDRCTPRSEVLRGRVKPLRDNDKKKPARTDDDSSNEKSTDEKSAGIIESAGIDDSTDDLSTTKSVLGRYRHKLRRFLIRSMLSLDDSG
ncbi:hypothetical protein GNI_018860 [Gregarina niphandrodes]|uniref:Uncharacterized protein n=1 Tax=Gregarina niphandrodes TaxID=110365 RepID=A0A023BBX0_GRENI|nr:hypothetical protein GNI_018860 [Gregarina niphandrodes]EZG81486.1 hypothetical protein GNI_018860 [Gregarina niphandrodes]|eukprot:XP_011134223.1 hypothetical protein GNI_018860 [Gregarina niphandrodes]